MLNVFILALLASIVSVALVDLLKTFIPNASTIAKVILSVLISIGTGTMFSFAEAILATFIGKLVMIVLFTIAITQLGYNYIAKAIQYFKNKQN